MSESKKIVIEIEIDKKNAGKRLAETEKELARLSKLRSELIKKAKEGNTLSEQEAKLLETLTIDIQKQTKARNQTIKAIQNEENSINSLRAKIGELTDERNNLNTATEEGRKRFDELTISLKEHNENLNNASKQAGNFKDNIGNYTESVKEAISETSIFGLSVGDLQGFFKTMKLGILESVQSLGIFKLALIGTGIGALIIAVGSLITFLTQTEKGAKQLGVVIARFKPVVDSIISVFSLLGETVFGVIDGISQLFTYVSDSLFGTTLEAGAELEKQLQNIDLENSKAEAMQKELIAQQEKQKTLRDDESRSFPQRIADNIKLGKLIEEQGRTLLATKEKELSLLNKKLERTPIDLRTTEQIKKIDEVRKEIADEKADIEGRIAEQIQNQNSLYREQKGLQNEIRSIELELEIAQGKVAKGSQEELNRKIELAKANRSLEASNSKMYQNAQKYLGGIIPEDQIINAVSLLDDNVKKITKSTQLEVQNLTNEFAQNAQDKAKENKDKAIQLQSDLMKAQILLAKEGSAERLELEIKLANQEAIIRKQAGETAKLVNAETKVAIFELNKSYNEKILEDYIQTTEKLLEQTQKTYDSIQKASEEVVKERSNNVESIKLSLAEELLAIESSDKSKLEKKKEIDLLFSDYNNQLRQAEIEKLKEQRDFDLLFTATSEEDRKSIKLNYAKATLDIDIQALEAKKTIKQAELDVELQTALAVAQIAGALIQIAGENTAIGRFLGIAQATVNTYVGASKALEAYAVTPVLAVVQAGIIIATGLASVAKIVGIEVPDVSGSLGTISGALGAVSGASKTLDTAKNPKPKFATGGLVSGIGSSTSDSIPAMLSDGESVLTAKATTMFMPLLSALNVAGGGVPFVSNFASGGIATAQSIQSINLGAISSDFANALANMPTPVVSVIDINRATNRRKVKVAQNSL